MRPILLATDGSPSAEAATLEAIELARALDAPLIVASVAHTALPTYGGVYGYGEIAADLKKLEAEHARQLLSELEHRLATAGLTCETLPLEGIPAGDAICEAAKSREARLVVIGAHGWGRLGRLLHGSVSTYVLHHAPCPVLVVHGEQAQQARVEAASASAIAF